MIKRCWYCGERLGAVCHGAIGIKGVYCDADCLEAQRNKVCFASPKQELGEWIDVNERLPKNKELVLLHLAELYYDSRIHLGYRWLTGNGGHAMYQIQNLSAVGEREVTHWQPLPAPPVIQKDESGRCGDCAHWHLDESLGDIPCNWGTCDASNEALRTRTRLGVWGLGVDEVRVTASYWGCVQFAKGKDA